VQTFQKIDPLAMTSVYWCLQIDQKTNEIFLRISALAARQMSNQNKKVIG